jgi:hypothetical protein
MHSNILVHFSPVHNGKKRSGLLAHAVSYVDQEEEVICTDADAAAAARIWFRKPQRVGFVFLLYSPYSSISQSDLL